MDARDEAHVLLGSASAASAWVALCPSLSYPRPVLRLSPSTLSVPQDLSGLCCCSRQDRHDLGARGNALQRRQTAPLQPTRQHPEHPGRSQPPASLRNAREGAELCPRPSPPSPDPLLLAGSCLGKQPPRCQQALLLPGLVEIFFFKAVNLCRWM